MNNTFIDRKSLKSEVASSLPFPVQLSIVVQSLVREYGTQEFGFELELDFELKFELRLEPV